jgi:type IV pilus assembly protein PilB
MVGLGVCKDCARRPRSHETPRSDARLGELLLKDGLITEQQLHEALDFQKQFGRRLAGRLVWCGYVTGDQIRDALSRTHGVPVVDLDEIEIVPALRRIIPLSTTMQHQLIPIARSGRTLTVAMADPTNAFALDDIKSKTGYDVRPVVASPVQLEREIETYDTRFGFHEALRRWNQKKTAQQSERTTER